MATYVNLQRGKQFSGYLHLGSMEEELWPHAQAKLLSFYFSCEAYLALHVDELKTSHKYYVNHRCFRELRAQISSSRSIIAI